MRARGLSLVAVLAFVALVSTLGFLTDQLTRASRFRLETNRQTRSAAAMADTGLDYARYMLRRGRWRGLRRFDSSDLGEGRQFRLDIFPQGPGRFRVVATGQAGAARVQREVRFP